MSHDVWKKEKLLNLSELAKALEDEQMHFLNNNRETTNYACSSKLNKKKQSKQKRRRGTEKGSYNKGENRK